MGEKRLAVERVENVVAQRAAKHRAIAARVDLALELPVGAAAARLPVAVAPEKFGLRIPRGTERQRHGVHALPRAAAAGAFADLGRTFDQAARNRGTATKILIGAPCRPHDRDNNVPSPACRSRPALVSAFSVVADRDRRSTALGPPIANRAPPVVLDRTPRGCKLPRFLNVAPT